MRIFSVIACTSLVLSMAQARANEAGAPDLLTLARGAVLVSADVDPTQAVSLTDGDAASSWSTPMRRIGPPYRFVFELAAPADLTALGVIGAGDRPGGIAGGSAGAVRFEGSAEGPETGFSPLAAFTAAAVGETRVDVTPDQPVRWLRLTIDSAISQDALFVYLADATAYGTMAAPDAPDRFAGRWQIGRVNVIELFQDGVQVSGCYVEDSGFTTGTLRGAVQNGVALMSWTSDKDITGTAVLTIDSGGAISGVRYRQRSRTLWGGPVAPDDMTTPCSIETVATTPDVPGDPIVAALEADEVVRFYDILFDTDSDVPKPSSAPALARLRDALVAAPDLAVVIEGHTDADGSDTYNQDLSNRRAASVVGWLVAEGIEPGRLAPEGFGEAQPVASNATADGKALNRRVDVRRQ